LITITGVSAAASELDELEVTPIGPRRGATEGHPIEGIRELSNDGRTSVGIWECTPGRFPVRRDGSHSFMYVLSGEATVVGSEGDRHELRPGSVLVEPDGWTGEWEIRTTIRKVSVITRTID
jgi:uncharacterized protein